MIKRLYDVNDGEIFEIVKPAIPGVGGKMIRLRGTKHNALCLASYQIKQINFNEEVRIIGRLEMKLIKEFVKNSRFNDLFGAAVNNLVEYYDELSDANIVAGIKERIEDRDTGNDQSDYEHIRNLVERFVQNWIVDGRF